MRDSLHSTPDDKTREALRNEYLAELYHALVEGGGDIDDDGDDGRASATATATATATTTEAATGTATGAGQGRGERQGQAHRPSGPTFAQFSSFVENKEESLWKLFCHIDSDQDMLLAPHELHDALAKAGE